MTTISTDPVARTEILARIRRASTDITNSDPVADVPIEWEYGTGIDMVDDGRYQDFCRNDLSGDQY